MSQPAQTLAGPLRAWPAGWWHVVFLVLDLVVGLIGITLATVAVVAVSTIPAALVGLVILAPTLWAAELFGRAERHRIAAFLGVYIEPPAPLTHPQPWRRWFLDANRWRATGYAALSGLWATTIGSVVLTILGAGVALVVGIVVPGLVPTSGVTLLWWTVPGTTAMWVLWAAGAVVLVGVPFVAPALSAVDVHLARWLLGADPQRRLEALHDRVDSLTQARDATVDSVEAERRRIERDLHDGPQQRLVSIAMDLGMARDALDRDPDQARALLDQAHSASKEAIVEIRNVARGIAPPILLDRGLDAAVSALAARSSVPVSVDVTAMDRLDPAIEAIAYFCVSEALTNVAKHSGAASASVRLRHDDGRVVVTVVDDGQGGADPGRGTGLHGLRQRVGAVDGTVSVVSPPGGPTVLTASLPDRARPR